ncbi:hypothetical protein QR680_014820 [Steinernema hermaphroditum]|uniref:Uncharacterized protein n=1 Tax=Steinernema hermaphroditum TaxID=289476 RepID=A0AA39ICE8_9BILA|nr:hypothetical protein QR680_014820 [Steinernema hermaphroditum]
MVPPGKENLAKRAESAFKTVYRCKRLQVFLILFWNWCKSTRFYGWCEEMIPNMPKNRQRKVPCFATRYQRHVIYRERIFQMIQRLHSINEDPQDMTKRPNIESLRDLYWDRHDIYGEQINALENEERLKELLTEDPEESDVDNIVIIAAEFLFEFAQNAQFSIAPNVLVAPFSAIQATLMFLIIGSADPPLNKAFWFLFILFSSCFLHHITAKVFVCTVTCNGSVETKNYGYVGHWLCSDMWSSSPRCP